MYKNTKKQGDAGLGFAIGFFTCEGLNVSIPLTDSQDYDLIVDTVDGLDRVQVKHTTYKRHGSFVVSLTVKGGNRTSVGMIKKLDPTKVDSIFIHTTDSNYWIPVFSLKGQNTITLNKKWNSFKV